MSNFPNESSTLRAVLEPIVLDETLTKKERTDLLVVILKQVHSLGSFEAVSAMWNDTMASIVVDNKLGRH